MLATGADDGGVRIWDLRAFGSTASSSGGASGVSEKERPAFVANFQFHRAPVTSVEWARFDGAMLASAAADHTVCVWDLAVERDAEEEAAAPWSPASHSLFPAAARERAALLVLSLYEIHERYHLDSAGATNGIAALDFGHCVLGFAIARETE